MTEAYVVKDLKGRIIGLGRNHNKAWGDAGYHSDTSIMYAEREGYRVEPVTVTVTEKSEADEAIALLIDARHHLASTFPFDTTEAHDTMKRIDAYLSRRQG